MFRKRLIYILFIILLLILACDGPIEDLGEDEPESKLNKEAVSPYLNTLPYGVLHNTSPVSELLSYFEHIKVNYLDKLDSIEPATNELTYTWEYQIDDTLSIQLIGETAPNPEKWYYYEKYPITNNKYILTWKCEIKKDGSTGYWYWYDIDIPDNCIYEYSLLKYADDTQYWEIYQRDTDEPHNLLYHYILNLSPDGAGTWLIEKYLADDEWIRYIYAHWNYQGEGEATEYAADGTTPFQTWQWDTLGNSLK